MMASRDYDYWTGPDEDAYSANSIDIGQVDRFSSHKGSSYWKQMVDYYSSEHSADGCCGTLQFETVVPGFALVAVSFFILFLLNNTLLRRRKRYIHDPGQLSYYYFPY